MSVRFEALPASVVTLMVVPVGQFEHEEVVVPMIGVGPLFPDAAVADPKISLTDPALPDTMTFPVVVAPSTVTNDGAVPISCPVPTSAAVPMDAGLTAAVASAGAVVPVVPPETAVAAVLGGESITAVLFVK